MFKLGDRVECITARITTGNHKLLGEKGTIIGMRHGKIHAAFAIEFDNEILGHDCGGIGKSGHCYWIDENFIKYIYKEPIPANTQSSLSKQRLHADICAELSDIYKTKNADYGDSFAKLRQEIPEAILVRVYDKYSRLKTLLQGAEQQVKDESIDDTLMDLANYCILELIERKLQNEN